MGLLNHAMAVMLKKPDTWSRIEKLSIPEPNSGCVLWLGALSSKGYALITGPRLNFKSSAISVPRLVLANKLGYIPTNALHTCDVRCCISEYHLYEGSIKQNSHDMWNRARHDKPQFFRKPNGHFNGSSKACIGGGEG